MKDSAHQAQKTPAEPDLPSGTPGGKVGPRGTVDAPDEAVEKPSVKSDEAPDPNDLTGPGEDPARGDRRA